MDELQQLLYGASIRFLGKTEWMKLWRREGGMCLACGESFSQLVHPTEHHLKPRSQGGADDLRNLVMLCRQCHDKLEVAQEAMLSGTNYPPTRGQITGIFEKRGKDEATAWPPRIPAKRRRWHAARILGQPRAVQLLKLHKLFGYWSHVDWDMVEKGLKEAGKI